MVEQAHLLDILLRLVPILLQVNQILLVELADLE